MQWGLFQFALVSTVASVPMIFQSKISRLSQKLPETIEDLILYLPYFLYPLVGLLGFRLHSNRTFFVSMTWLFAFSLQSLWEKSPPFLIDAFWIAIPLSLLLHQFPKESRFFSKTSLLHLGISFIPTFIVFAILHPTIKGQLPLEIPLESRFLSLAFILGHAMILIFQKERSFRGFHFALILCYLPFSTSLLNSRNELLFSLSHDCIGFVLLYAVYRLYWQKIFIDELTQIPNRRSLNDALETLNPPYTIAMIDIDHFKKFNDTYGHEAGDHVLRLVAKHFATQSGNRVYRYGGEEFCIIHTQLNSHELESWLDRMRKLLEKRHFFLRPSKRSGSRKDRGKPHSRSKIKITVSIGAASPKKLNSPNEVIQLADRALYQAKESGRNRVVLAK